MTKFIRNSQSEIRPRPRFESFSTCQRTSLARKLFRERVGLICPLKKLPSRDKKTEGRIITIKSASQDLSVNAKPSYFKAAYRSMDIFQCFNLKKNALKIQAKPTHASLFYIFDLVKLPTRCLPSLMD